MFFIFAALPFSVQAKQVCMNIYIHGIISIKPHITVTNFIRFLTDNVKESIYAETVLGMRDDAFFYQNQTMQGRGLIPIQLNPALKPGASASLMANVYEHLNKLNGNNEIENLYYTYGWSGLLSRSERYADAKQCLLDIEKEVVRLRSMGINPTVRVIGYSHGGTIVLKMAMAKRNEKLNPQFTINEAILIGTPIQFDTDYLINDPLFEKVYNVFSRGDRVQKLDFFSCGEFFSEQLFKPHCGFEKLPDKLTQLEIRVIRKRGETCKTVCTGNNGESLLYDGKHCSRLIRNVSPGHMELWFFGWTPRHYRANFPLYPLPIVSFLPYILNSVNSLAHSDPRTPFVVTIDAQRNSMIIKNNLLCPQAYQLPFIGLNNLVFLQKLALDYQPVQATYNQEEYHKHITRAYDQAVAIIKEKKCAKKLDEAIVCAKSTE
jgi:hypothetical protein